MMIFKVRNHMTQEKPDILDKLPKSETPKPKFTEGVIRVEHLYKSFGENHILIDFNLDLKQGEHVAVLGKSGSGKSVFIKCLIGFFFSGKE